MPQNTYVSKQIREALEIVAVELEEAMSKHAPLNSAHEGWAVIAEEVDELWDEVKKKRADRNREKMHAEAKQIAAMAVRFMLEVQK